MLLEPYREGGYDRKGCDRKSYDPYNIHHALGSASTCYKRSVDELHSTAVSVIGSYKGLGPLIHLDDIN